MISVKVNNKLFMKEMNNIMEYSVGFVEGMINAKPVFLQQLGMSVSELSSEFIDANARINPATLHHVYEWTKTGSPNARLFDIKFSVNSAGLNFSSKFKQSETIKNGSNVPFRDKAKIMESGTSVTITPREAQALVFEVDGETIYTKGSVVVDNPGGNTEGQFAKVFDLFFNKYFTQAFLKSSGLYGYFNNPKVYKVNLKRGKSGGRRVGINTGYNWVAGAVVNR